MKKIVVIGGMLLGMSVGAFAQHFNTWESFPESPKNRNSVIGNIIDRMLTKASATKVSRPGTLTKAIAPGHASWKEELIQLKKLTANVSENVKTQFPTPVQFVNSLSDRDKITYAQRFLVVQKSVQKNPVLTEFIFVVPMKEDLVRFSEDNYAALLAFFADSADVRVHSRLCQPFTLSVKVCGSDGGSLELWINAAEKKIYLMSDNFFSTADEKYKLQLR